MNTAVVPQESSAELSALKLAIAVLRDRISGLPQEDKADLLELTKIVFAADNEEERQSAIRAMEEIMEQRPLALARFEASDHAPLADWLSFISGRIREERTKRGLTQAELADKAGLTQSHVSRLENGEHSPSHMTRKKLADALGINESQLDPSADR